MSAAAEAAAETKWHSVTAEEALRLLESTEAGLSNEEADKRLKEYGPNALTPPPKPTFLRRLWNQINT
jgi:magnesium-transporting ATPase (P-type)